MVNHHDSNLIALEVVFHLQLILLLAAALCHLGSITSSHEYASPFRILLGHSMWWPLVRGELCAIAIIRGMVLLGLCLVLPPFALYNVVMVPLQGQLITRQLQQDSSVEIPNHRNASVENDLSGSDAIGSLVMARIVTTDGKSLNCSTSGSHSFCPATWASIIDCTVLYNLTRPLSHFATSAQPAIGHVKVTTYPGYNFYESWLYSEPILLFCGSHLIVFITWVQREVFVDGSPGIRGSSAPTIYVYSSEAKVDAIQTDPDPLSIDPDMATLRIMQLDPGRYQKSFQDYKDTSALTGLATVGGFWTFVNGALIFFFGVNVMYFLFGRRPLSAPGVVHFLQRRSLVRKWNKDFPTIHTEGGQPGSETAGIVAFIRERLVDIDDDSSRGDAVDLKAQIDSTNTGYQGVGGNEETVEIESLDSSTLEMTWSRSKDVLSIND
ncbi:hypothetical protein B0H10DRAFT_1979912 [Mycena sp. CBHHK59/15]|nr:hypothetical protein B0H10DRAFT_1979912 [Mycena sp. CBHHK59/15]